MVAVIDHDDFSRALELQREGLERRVGPERRVAERAQQVGLAAGRLAPEVNAPHASIAAGQRLQRAQRLDVGTGHEVVERRGGLGEEIEGELTHARGTTPQGRR